LEAGADVSIRNLYDETVLHDITKYISFRKHSYQLIQLLINYDADVNAVSSGKGPNKDYYYVPLRGAITNMDCAKLLLANGADLYANFESTYIVWYDLLGHAYNDNIYVAKYLIIEKNMPIPATIAKIGNVTLDAFSLLKDKTAISASENKARLDILNYLKRIGFPRRGALINPQ